MSSVLLDTHAFLWFVFDDARLSETAAAAISGGRSQPTLSIASLWELTIKQQIGKLDLGMPLEDFLREFVTARELDILALTVADLSHYGDLPLHHRDPFDRILIAQAQRTGMPLVSRDPAFTPYALQTVW